MLAPRERAHSLLRCEDRGVALGEARPLSERNTETDYNILASARGMRWHSDVRG